MRLIQWRSDRKLSQAEAARLLGLGSARTFQRYETGEREAGAEVVEAIKIGTDHAVTADDMQATRLEWVRQNGKLRLPAEHPPRAA